VHAGETNVWVDAGSGTLANLQRHVGLLDVDAVVLSHEHPDHWSDLQGFSVACQWVLEREGVPVYGPAGVRKAAAGFLGPLRWHDVSDRSTVQIGDLRFTFSRTDHPNETLGMRVDGGGRSLGYSADSGPGWSLAALGPGLDLALSEATFLKDRENQMQHLSGRQAGQLAKQAEAGRLLVTHTLPTLDRAEVAAEAADAFGGPVDAATEGMVVEL
jgi:ribonuclease BN (tRNA processing enzyme)